MFDSRNQKPNDHIPILDPVTTSDYTYNHNYQLPNYATNKNRPKNDDFGVGVQFRVEEMSKHVDDESGVSSPPLEKNSPPRNSVHPHHNSMNHRSISPSSRALAIAKGQWELMEIVKNMPESCYELSLKDLVEKNSILEGNQEGCLINKEEENLTSSISQEQVVKSIKRQESNKNKKGKMIRNESFEEKGSVLKVFFPIPLDPKKKEKMKNSTKTTKVSPKPIEGSDKSSRSLEKDWWKKRFSCSSESDSSKTGSSNSESTGRSGSSGSNDSSRKKTNRKKKGFLTNFWSRSCFSKSKKAE